MQTPPLDPDAADLAPTAPALTAYDEQHIVTYMRLLDAEADNADWREVTASFSISIRSSSLIALAKRSRAILRVQNGSLVTATAICCAAA